MNYKTPINHGFNAGEWELYPEFAGDIGLTGLLSVDLSKSELAEQRENVFQLLNERYGSLSN